MQAKVKSIYFNHPSQGTSTNYYLILGLRDKAAPPTSQQINKFPSEATEEPSDTVIHLLLYWMYAVTVLSPFLTGRLFVHEPSWKYSANLVGS